MSITVETRGKHIPDDDAEYLIAHSDTQCPFYAPMDYDIVVSERIKELTAQPRLFLLAPKDSSMHQAIMATIRIPGGHRQRSALGNTMQNTRRRENRRENQKIRKQEARAAAAAEAASDEEIEC